MPVRLDKNESALARGIRLVGIGKKGSQPLDHDLVNEILKELKAGQGTPAARGAFFSGLLLKGLTPTEALLDQLFWSRALSDPRRLVEYISPDAPGFIKEICADLLNKRELGEEAAWRVGTFLFSEKPGDGARGLIANALRVRYETLDEYKGLLHAMNDTIEAPFRLPVPLGDPVLQMAEPFDGVTHSHIITPLVAVQLQKQGYRVISLIGRNGGPKSGHNLLDLLEVLKIPLTQTNADVTNDKQAFGYYINQGDLSKSVDRWVRIRREIIKRPFLATLEKFFNPAKAAIHISSAFHSPYMEKMMALAQHCGFPGIIIVRGGIEGSTAVYLNRPAKLYCAAKQKDGTYQRKVITFDPAKYLEIDVARDERLEYASLKENARLVDLYRRHGHTDNKLFDLRIKATCVGLTQGLKWIRENI